MESGFLHSAWLFSDGTEYWIYLFSRPVSRDVALVVYGGHDYLTFGPYFGHVFDTDRPVNFVCVAEELLQRVVDLLYGVGC